ncbi:hypothetical protein L2E82_15310 [Cichorium intybus]|uniref:Uncharacterized protein n=1 Tax=Cichorium intybus TaxID=13427 RepID=A0ACB9F2V9_CICIN|nr:hypothetical protein L2E82_15310 [Cichorium intybus]
MFSLSSQALSYQRLERCMNVIHQTGSPALWWDPTKRQAIAMTSSHLMEYHNFAKAAIDKTDIWEFGAAVGFKLNTLPRLSDTKINDMHTRGKKMTFVHYLCKVLTDKVPELLDFSKELGSLEPASKIQLKILAEEMQAITKGLEKVVQEKELCKKDGRVSKRFRKVPPLTPSPTTINTITSNDLVSFSAYGSKIYILGTFRFDVPSAVSQK